MKTESDKDIADIESILWRGFVLPGHETCRLFFLHSEWHVEGTVVFSHEQQPCQLNYRVICNSVWQTRSAKISGWIGNRVIDLEIKVNPSGHWWLNRAEQPDVMGCIDLDLNFSPSTNLLPIRRLNLTVGQTAEVRAAWLRFPSFTLEMLPQQYHRLDETTYRYESAGGQFVTDLKVNRSGLIINYPGIWQAEATSG